MDVDAELIRLKKRLDDLTGGASGAASAGGANSPGPMFAAFCNAIDQRFDELRREIDRLKDSHASLEARLAEQGSGSTDADPAGAEAQSMRARDYSDEDDVPGQIKGALDSKKPDPSAPANPSAGTEPSENPNDPARGEAG
jgi:hypothetical protein